MVLIPKKEKVLLQVTLNIVESLDFKRDFRVRNNRLKLNKKSVTVLCVREASPGTCMANQAESIEGKLAKLFKHLKKKLTEACKLLYIVNCK